jgi:hypothetical protein
MADCSAVSLLRATVRLLSRVLPTFLKRDSRDFVVHALAPVRQIVSRVSAVFKSSAGMGRKTRKISSRRSMDKIRGNCVENFRGAVKREFIRGC